MQDHRTRHRGSWSQTRVSFYSHALSGGGWGVGGELLVQSIIQTWPMECRPAVWRLKTQALGLDYLVRHSVLLLTSYVL